MLPTMFTAALFTTVSFFLFQSAQIGLSAVDRYASKTCDHWNLMPVPGSFDFAYPSGENASAAQDMRPTGLPPSPPCAIV